MEGVYDTRNTYRENASERRLDDGDPLQNDTRSTTRNQWRRDGSNHVPSEALIASFHNLRRFLMRQQDISDEFEPRGIARESLVDMAAAMVCWPLRHNPEDRSCIVPEWNSELVRPILVRMLDGDDTGDRWEPGVQITAEIPADTKGGCIEVGYTVRDTRKGGVGRGDKPCDRCDISKKVVLRMDKNDCGVPNIKLNCMGGHYKSKDDVSFYHGRSLEDWVDILMQSFDRTEKQWTADYNIKMIMYNMRLIINVGGYMSDRERAQRAPELLTDLEDIKMRLHEPKLKWDGFLRVADAAIRNGNNKLPAHLRGGATHELQQQLAQSQAHVTTLNGQVQTLQTQLTAANAAIAAANAAAAAAANGNALAGMQAERDRARQSATLARQEATTATQQRDMLRAQLNGLNQTPDV